MAVIHEVEPIIKIWKFKVGKKPGGIPKIGAKYEVTSEVDEELLLRGFHSVFVEVLDHKTAKADYKERDTTDTLFISGHAINNAIGVRKVLCFPRLDRDQEFAEMLDITSR